MPLSEFPIGDYDLVRKLPTYFKVGKIKPQDGKARLITFNSRWVKMFSTSGDCTMVQYYHPDEIPIKRKKLIRKIAKYFGVWYVYKNMIVPETDMVVEGLVLIGYPLNIKVMGDFLDWMFIGSTYIYVEARIRKAIENKLARRKVRRTGKQRYAVKVSAKRYARERRNKFIINILVALRDLLDTNPFLPNEHIIAYMKKLSRND